MRSKNMAVAMEQIAFGPYRCDPQNARVWWGEHLVSLPPRAFDVLVYLLRHPGQLVSKKELLTTLWSETYVGDAVLKVCIGEIRKALADDAKNPQFIETVPRRGYRFIAPLIPSPPVSRSLSPAVDSIVTVPTSFQLETWNLKPETFLVGRDIELATLHNLLEKALRGERQVVFITGEPGIGKTALVDRFLSEVWSRNECGVGSDEEFGVSTGPKSKVQTPKLRTLNSELSSTPSPWVAQGQCLEHYGAGEAYLPVLEALGGLHRSPRKEQLVKCLRQYAPTWLAHMPALTSPAERQQVDQAIIGATREHMLREGADALDALTQEAPLILVLEDLHWSDYATLDLMAALARRREPARLFVIGTYRPVDVIVSDHPLKSVKQELQGRGQCEEICLGLLSPSEVATYLTQRFPAHALPAEVANIIHRCTDGNPLFLINVVDDLITRGVFRQVHGRWEFYGKAEQIAAELPVSTRQIIERQIERLTSDEQQVLEAASVVGMEFTTAAVEAALEEPRNLIEELCERLARQQRFLRVKDPKGWPDGTYSDSYVFSHALYHNVFLQRVAAGRRQRLHQRIGDRLEAAYGAHADTIAVELSLHFEQGREYRRALRYLRLAAENAVRRYAYREALRYLIKGLHLLSQLPDVPERTQHELRLQATLGPTLMALKGTAAPEVEHAYQRARELCRQTGETSTLFPILRGLFASAVMQGKLVMGQEYAEQLLQLAQRRGDSASLLQAYYALGMTYYRQGAFLAARSHLQQCQTLYDAQQHFVHTPFYGGSDTGVGAHCFMAWTLWYLGYADQALAQGHAATALAQSLAHPYSQAFALNFTAWVHKLRREAVAAQTNAEAAIAIASEHGYAQMVTLGTIVRGWALVAQRQEAEGLSELQRGIEAWRATGTEDGRPYFLALLADAYSKTERIAEGLSLLNEAIAVVAKNGEYIHEAHVYHLKGCLLLAPLQSAVPSPQSEAEACFQHALQVARRQQAKALELRAATSLSNLWAQAGKQRQARQLLGKMYGWFTEAHSTPDLREAQALLGQWSLH